MGKSALAMFAEDKTAIFEVTQSQSDCNTTDIKAAAELMFAGDGERGLLVAAEDFLRHGGNQLGPGS